MSGFTKLVPGIIQSSIWNEPSDVRVVWITMLAIKDEHGYVRGDVNTLTRLANVPTDAVEKALESFQKPDPGSHTPDNEGRRIEAAPGGWIVLNHAIYRQKDRTAYMREYMRKRRKDAASSVVNSVNINGKLPSVSVSASVSEDRGCKGKGFSPPSPQEVESYSQEIAYPVNGQAWCDAYAQKGWMVGKTKMKDWKAALRNWKRNEWKPGPPVGQKSREQFFEARRSPDEARSAI